MLMFIYLSVTTVNVSVTSKAHVGNNESTLCLMVIPKLNLLSAYATSGFVNEIVATIAITHKGCYVDVHET